jgi:CysZ protein
VNRVAAALAGALPLLADRRVLALVLLPLIAAALLWGAMAWAFLAPVAAAVTAWLASLGLDGQLALVAAAAGHVVAFALFTVAAGALALAAIAVLAAPVFVRVVEERAFPGLTRARGGTLAGGLANAAVTLAVWLPLWLVTLPLLLVPLVGVPASLLLAAWLNQRLFRYDALAEHASAEERRAVFRSARWRLYLLGLIVAPLALLPVVNLVAPLYAGLAFTHLCLAELAALRGGAQSRAEGA